MSAELIEEDYAALENGEEPGSAINQSPVGNSTICIDRGLQGQEIRTEQNEVYRNVDGLDSITFRVVPEGSTRPADLETGAVHVSDPISPSDMSRVENTSGVRVNQQPSVSLSYIGFNAEKEPYDNKCSRQALSKAIDKDTIIEGIYQGIGLPATSPLAPDVFGYDEDVSGLEV